MSTCQMHWVSLIHIEASQMKLLIFTKSSYKRINKLWYSFKTLLIKALLYSNIRCEHNKASSSMSTILSVY